MSKKAQQRATRRVRLLKVVQSPPPPEPRLRMFPPVCEPFYLPELLGLMPDC